MQRTQFAALPGSAIKHPVPMAFQVQRLLFKFKKYPGAHIAHSPSTSAERVMQFGGGSTQTLFEAMA